MHRRIYFHARTALFVDYLLFAQLGRAIWDRIDPTYPLSR